MGAFERSVFINCPFDEDYRQLLLALTFTVKYLGFTPRLASQTADSGNSRIGNIVELIRTCKFGIHDLSRIESTKKGELHRMNMPFELGIDYGCKALKGGKWKKKKLLVLETKKYRYQAALSDFSGSDIAEHNDDPVQIIHKVRDWFVIEELGVGSPGGARIWYQFNDFTVYLERTLVENGYSPDDYDRAPISEVLAYMDQWISEYA